MCCVRPLMYPLFFLSILPFSFVQAADKPALIGGDTNPLSITRIHDRVNYMVSLKFNNGKMAQQWRSVDCKQSKAQLLYEGLLSEEGYTKARFTATATSVMRLHRMISR